MEANSRERTENLLKSPSGSEDNELDRQLDQVNKASRFENFNESEDMNEEYSNREEEQSPDEASYDNQQSYQDDSRMDTNEDFRQSRQINQKKEEYYEANNHMRSIDSVNRNEEVISERDMSAQLSQELPDSEDEERDFVKDVKLVLKKLFGFYGSFGSRASNNKMNFTQFLKLATDACLVGHGLDQRKVTLIFTSVNKVQSNLTYEKFVKVLHGLGQAKFKKGDSNQKFKDLLSKHILPLYETIYEETDLGTEDRILKSKVPFPTLMLIHLRLATLKAVYQRFFKSEMTQNYMISEQKMYKASRQDLFTFLREFELLPSLLNNSLASNFFHEIFSIDQWIDQMGQHAQSVHDLAKVVSGCGGISFTFFKFIYFLIKISLYVFSDPSNVPLPFRELTFTPDEKFYLLLERLEVSQGFLGLCLTHVGKVTHPRLVLTAKEITEMHKETGAFPHFEDFISPNSQNKPWMLIDCVKSHSPGQSQNMLDLFTGSKSKSRPSKSNTASKRKSLTPTKQTVEVPNYILK